MANLSERLWKLAAMSPKTFGLLAHSSAMRSQFYTTTAEAAELIDRLTVEGLAGLTARWHGGLGAPILPEDRRFAQAILDLITTPSVEETHD